MAKLTPEERRAIARRRMVRVLGTHGIANWRTLEQKIADAGPGHLRVDPHILTPVRKELEEQGVIADATKPISTVAPFAAKIGNQRIKLPIYI